MRIEQLDGTFLRLVSKDSYEEGVALSVAQGLMFLCPVCFVKNHGPVGTHSVICWFRDKGVPSDAEPGPGRWIPTGSSLADITLTPSVLLPDKDGCQWHGWVRAGDVT